MAYGIKIFRHIFSQSLLPTIKSYWQISLYFKSQESLATVSILNQFMLVKDGKKKRMSRNLMSENKIKWIKYEGHSSNSYDNDNIKMANWNIMIVPVIIMIIATVVP